MNIKTVLITDGECRASLAALRSLAKKGFRIVVTSKQKTSISSASKFCAKSHQTVDPILNEKDYVGDIADVVKSESIDLILPITEPSVMALLKYQGMLPEKTIIASPDMDKVKMTYDKISTFRLAQKLGVPIPQTVFVDNPSELSFDKYMIDSFPAVLKPYMSKIPSGDGFISTGITYVNDAEDLKRQITNNPIFRRPFMIQEKISGEGTGLFTLFDKDKHMTLFCHKRLREKPPTGGVSVVSESIPLDGVMVDSSKNLLSAIGWNGIAMVEFKRDMNDGIPKLMEINGRFWGSLQLAISSGVDFPVYLVDYLNGTRKFPLIGEYKSGLKLKWFLGMLDYLIIRLKNKDSISSLPKGSPSIIGFTAELLNVFERDCVYDVFDRRDIRPFITELKEYIKNIIPG